jgi:hypothetical protein
VLLGAAFEQCDGAAPSVSKALAGPAVKPLDSRVCVIKTLYIPFMRFKVLCKANICGPSSSKG